MNYCPLALELLSRNNDGGFGRKSQLREYKNDISGRSSSFSQNHFCLQHKALRLFFTMWFSLQALSLFSEFHHIQSIGIFDSPARCCNQRY